LYLGKRWGKQREKQKKKKKKRGILVLDNHAALKRSRWWVGGKGKERQVAPDVKKRVFLEKLGGIMNTQGRGRGKGYVPTSRSSPGRIK